MSWPRQSAPLTRWCRDGDGWRALTTDVEGIVGAIRAAAVAPASITILGAGGTAQNALAAARELGVARCAVLVRDESRAVDLRATADRIGTIVDLGALDSASPALTADLVISTLPKGAADTFAAVEWRAGQAVLDVVYDPWPTVLVESVAARDATVISGASMLLHQAVRQVELMTGRTAPIDAMRDALRAAAPSAGL